jgi:YesN/AraC family two-component response regulator
MRTLIVEDELITALDLREILEAYDHEVVGTASNYDDALFLAKTEVPELALLDVNLHGDKDGISLAKTLREEFNIIIIFVTAYASRDVLTRAKQYSPNGYIVKPFTPDSIYAAIELANIDHLADGMRQFAKTASLTGLTDKEGLPRQVKENVLDYIEKRFNRDLPISELSDLVKLSEDYFTVQFKKSVGSTPHQYIMKKRLEEAKYLLRHTEQPMDEVSRMVGYANQAYFATIFKKHYGMTPSQYRKS